MSALKNALQKNIDAAKLLGVNMSRIALSAEKFGAENYIKTMIKRDDLGDGFDALAKMGRLDLSWQALVVDKRFGDLFDDEEVNYCYMVLIDFGYTKF